MDPYSFNKLKYFKTMNLAIPAIYLDNVPLIGHSRNFLNSVEYLTFEVH